MSFSILPLKRIKRTEVLYYFKTKKATIKIKELEDEYIKKLLNTIKY